MRRIGSVLWRLAAAGLAHLVGAAFGSRLVELMSLQAQRVPVEIDPARQWWLALVGGVVIACGLAAMAIGLTGSTSQRWLVLTIFAFIVNGVSVALETHIFTTLGGELAYVSGTLLASALCAAAVVILFPVPDATELHAGLHHFLRHWSPGALATRLTFVLLAFPLFYLMFGAMVAPVVNPLYGEFDFMHIPPFRTIIETQLLRSILFLLASLPIVVGWVKPRWRLALALGLGHFTAVGLNGLVQTPFFPPTMAFAHALEILGDSAAYAWTIAFLLLPVDAAPAARKGPSRLLIDGSRAFRAVTAILCFVAIGSWSHLYYISVRWIVLVSCLSGAAIAFRLTLTVWGLILGAVAVVFNPLFPMPFSQQLWMATDALAGLLLLASAVMPWNDKSALPGVP